MSIAAIVAAAARELERTLLSDTCTITAIRADGSDGAAVTVRCMVGTAGGGGPFGGGGNQLSRPPDDTILLPRATTVQSGDRITRQSTGQTYSVGSVPALKSHDALLAVQCVEIGS